MTSILRFPIVVGDALIEFNPDNPEPVTFAINDKGSVAYIKGDGSVRLMWTRESFQVALLKVLLHIGDVVNNTRLVELFDLHLSAFTTAHDIETLAEYTASFTAAIPGGEIEIMFDSGVAFVLVENEKHVERLLGEPSATATLVTRINAALNTVNADHHTAAEAAFDVY